MTPVQRAVVARCGVTLEQLQQPTRGSNELVRARHLAFYLERTVFGRTFKDIGQLYGRDHGTVMAGVNHVDERIRRNDLWFGQYIPEVEALAKHEASVDQVRRTTATHEVTCPTCGTPLIAEVKQQRRQIEELMARIKKMEEKNDA